MQRRRKKALLKFLCHDNQEEKKEKTKTGKKYSKIMSRKRR
jgi:hypothetical protein